MHGAIAPQRSVVLRSYWLMEPGHLRYFRQFGGVQQGGVKCLMSFWIDIINVS